MKLTDIVRKMISLELRGGKVITVFAGILGLMGGILGYLLLPTEWSDVRRIAGGVTGGLGSALIIIMSRWVGAYSETK